VPLPRATGPGFEPYGWAAQAEDVAARHGLSPAHVLRFDSNLPPFPAALPAEARAALSLRADYPEGTYRELREAAAAYAGCEPDEVTVDAGADGLIGLVARTYLEHGRVAAVQQPTYPLYAIASRIEGAEVAVAPADLDALPSACAGAAVVWLCNPANPTGRLLEPAAIAELADRMPQTVVCVDEAYFEFADATTAPFAQERENLVCVRTLSKAFALAGLRVGYAVSSRTVARELTDRRAPGPIANLAAAIGAAALRDPAPARADASLVCAERDRLREAFRAAGWDAPDSHASFVVVRTADAPGLALELERRGLVVRGYADLLRISPRTSAEDDLVLTALGVDPPPAAHHSSVVFAPAVRVSLALDGRGRATSRTGDNGRDAGLEARAAAAGWDLEAVADEGAESAVLEAALAEAEERARSGAGAAVP